MSERRETDPEAPKRETDKREERKPAREDSARYSGDEMPSGTFRIPRV